LRLAIAVSVVTGTSGRVDSTTSPGRKRVSPRGGAAKPGRASLRESGALVAPTAAIEAMPAGDAVAPDRVSNVSVINAISLILPPRRRRTGLCRYDIRFIACCRCAALQATMQYICIISASLFPGKQRVLSCFLGNSESIGEGGNILISERRARAKGEKLCDCDRQPWRRALLWPP
jgi:hypothetical protein